MGGAVMAQRHPRRGAGGAGERRREGFPTGVTVEKKKLTSGVHASARGERVGDEDGRCEIKKKTYFCKYANDARGLSSLGRPVGFGLRERRGASGAGWGEGRVGREG
jgi:hypothetical protein